MFCNWDILALFSPRSKCFHIYIYLSIIWHSLVYYPQYIKFTFFLKKTLLFPDNRNNEQNRFLYIFTKRPAPSDRPAAWVCAPALWECVRRRAQSHSHRPHSRRGRAGHRHRCTRSSLWSAEHRPRFASQCVHSPRRECRSPSRSWHRNSVKYRRTLRNISTYR